jgi:Zn-dependent protease with chaperone function
MSEAMIEGTYFDGNSSSKQAASLYYTDSGRIGLQGVQREAIAFDMLKISSRIGDTPRYIEFPNGAQFETANNDAVDAMLAKLSGKPFQGGIHRLERAKHFVLATVLLVVLFAWGFVQYGVPYFSRELASSLPAEASRYLGQGVLDAMDKTWFGDSQLAEQRQQELHGVFDDLLASLDLHNIQLAFRQSEKIGANAFALPDGTIVFTDELVNLATDNREIAAVMLHEIGHLQHRHSLRAAIQRFSLAMFVMVVSGDVSTSSSIITAIPVMLVESGYSQGMETEADSFALQYMLQHELDPDSFARIMEKLQASHSDHFKSCQQDSSKTLQQCIDLAVRENRQSAQDGEGVTSYLSTHPATAERIRRFRSAGQE